ncbi:MULTISPECIES: SDR family NAD(P)-dependent oxidoreductase [unclassified Frankia]
MDFRGQTALITGASTGIGAVFAREFADRGADLVLVARGEDRLRANAAEITRRHGVRTEVIAVDLAEPAAVDAVAERVAAAGGGVDVLVNNAGFATHGDVAGAEAARLVGQVRLNCVAVVELTARFLPAMVHRGRGSIVNVASIAAFQPVAHMAVYAATKAFVLSFSEALWAEARPAGVRVLALCPGSTDTPFFDVVGTEDVAVGRKRSPEQAVASAMRALERGRPSVVDGRRNALLARGGRLLPRRALIRIAERAVRPAPDGSRG